MQNTTYQDCYKGVHDMPEGKSECRVCGCNHDGINPGLGKINILKKSQKPVNRWNTTPARGGT